MSSSRSIAWLSLLAAFLAAVGFLPHVFGQQTPPTTGGPARPSPTPAQQQETGEADVVRINTTLVTVPVSVADRHGRYLSDLRRDQFHVYENGVEQQVAYFAPVDKPFTVALLLDISDSTEAQLKLIQEAAIAFIERLRPDDRVIVVAFDSRVRLLAQPQMSRDALRAAIRALHSGQGTSLYAVVEETTKELSESVSGRKAIVLLTDGVDTTTPKTMSTFESSVGRAEESDVIVYPVQVNAPSDLDPSNLTTELRLRFPEPPSAHALAGVYMRAREYLHQLAEKTGGQFYVATELGKLGQSFARVADDLRRQYSLGYYPKVRPQAGEVREIKVTVDEPNTTVRARPNYVTRGKTLAPGDEGVKP
jgi:Ca-activated chloride channel family protein